MPIEENLTYLQKAAIKGEIAFALSTAAHNAEMKYRTYLMLREVDEKYRPLILECVKESVTFDEGIIDRIYLEVISNNVPVWLWIDEAISDIKLHLNTAEAGLSMLTGARLGIDKIKERKNIIESAFIMFIREAIILSPDAAEQLLDEVLNDFDLDFLHNACFYLKTGCSEMRAMKKEAALEEVPEELMSCLFDVKRMLSFSIESKALNMLNKAEKKEKRYQKITKQPLPTQEVPEEIVLQGNFTIDGTITHEELSQYISEKIAELFDGTSQKSKSTTTPSNKVYVVKKVFTDSGLSTDIRICKTEEEAINFVKKIVREYPELTNICEFQVHMENLHDKKNNRWRPTKEG